MSQRLTVLAPAKLNLFLHVTGRRADGYHTLQSVFQLIDLADTLHFAVRDDAKVSLHLEGDAASKGLFVQENLITQAAEALKAQDANPMRLGTDIWLEKRIPLGGGLGGGSSDAATTLLALNQLWNMRLSTKQLAHIGLQLGADVPFFLLGRNAWAEGIGDELTAIDLLARWYVVLHPGVHVATPRVFTHPDLTRNTPPAKIEGFAQSVLQHQHQEVEFLEAAEFFGRNDLQAVAQTLEPSISDALAVFAACGALARMTGSGACVFSAHASEAAAQLLAMQIKASSAWQDNWQVWVAKGLDRHPAHAQCGF
jgi:4-diphosphocytidyl-2-C-methyl-D-erythritol kinase